MQLKNMTVIKDPCQHVMDEVILYFYFVWYKITDIKNNKKLKHFQQWARFFD